MNKAIISLSFDDGRADNYNVFRKITMPLGIPATLNVITGYVEGNMPTESWPSGKSPMTKEQVIDLSNSPLMEIALHGDTHKNTEEDVKTARDKLADWIGMPDDGKWGFASPYSRLPVEEFKSPTAPTFFKNDLLYMRTGLKKEKPSSFRKLSTKAGKVLHFPFLYKSAYDYIIMQQCSDRVIYSFPIINGMSYMYVKGLVDAAVHYRGAITLMFHSVEPDANNGDDWSWDTEKFKKLCAFLLKMQNKNLLEIATTRQLYESIKTN